MGRTWLKRVVIGMIALLILAQFVPVGDTNPPVERDIPTTPEVKQVLRRACYDCHSHETVWPWYSHIAPISWLIVRDVDEGREELNFSAWARYSPEQQTKKLRKTWEEINDGEMPPWYYLPVHPDARLSDADRAILRQWTMQP